MSDRALFIGWNRVIAGREAQATELFQKSIGFYQTCQNEGKIDSFEPVILKAHGGDLNGFVIIRGDQNRIAAFREDDAFVDIVLECGYCLDGFGTVEGFIGDGIQTIMERWIKVIS